MKSVDYTKYITSPEGEFILRRRIVMEVSFDVERVTTKILNDVVVFVFAILHNQINSVLQRQQEQNSFFPRHSIHVHVVYFEQFITWYETLHRCWAVLLNCCHKNSNFVASSQSNANGAFFLECDVSRL